MKAKKIWTYKDFLEGKLKWWEEIIDGKKVKKKPAYKRHRKLWINLVFRLFRIIDKFEIFTSVVVMDMDKIEILTNEVVIKIDDYNIRIPDIVLIRKRPRRKNYKNDFKVIKEIPDLVIEIEDSRRLTRYIKRKISDYLKLGIKRQIWIFPAKEEVWDINNLGEKEILSFDNKIDIFGVKLKLKDLV